MIDDNAASRTVAREMLGTNSSGAIVYAANSGAAGIEAFAGAAREQEEPFGLILIDSMMPQMDGFRDARTDWTKPSDQHSGYRCMMKDSTGLTGKLKGLKGFGTVNYTVKPLKPRELYSKVEEILAAHGTPEAARAQSFQNGAGSGASETLRSLHVLLADDSPDNQNVNPGLSQEDALLARRSGKRPACLRPLHRKKADLDC